MFALAVVELVLCFLGPLAFVQRPRLVLFPPFSAQLDEAEMSQLTAFVEREIALGNSYSIVSQSFLEEYFIRTGAAFDRRRLKPANYDDAHQVARELEMERFAMISFYRYGGSCALSVSIRDVPSGEVVQSGNFSSGSLSDLLQGKGSDGKPLKISEDLTNNTRGLGLTGMIVLCLLGLQLLVGLLIVAGRELRVLVEVLWAFALILFVFAFIYAKNANMDYVQRFIATKGQLRLARSTAVEQVHAFLRFAPLLLANGGYYLWQVRRRQKHLRAGLRTPWVTRVFTSWALVWVVAAAALYAFSFPSFVRLDGLAPLAWFSMIPLFVVLATVRPARGIFYGVLFGTLQALLVNYWHGTYDYVTLHMITIVFALEYLAFMVVLVWLLKVGGKWGFLIVPALWTLFDYLRSVGVTGYPWGLIGTSQYGFLPFIQIASLTGVWGLGFVIILVNSGVAWALAAPARGWSWAAFGTRLPRRTPPLDASGSPDPEDPTAGWRAARVSRRVATMRYFFPVGIAAAVVVLCVIVGSVILLRIERRLYASADTPTATIVLLQHNADPRKYEYRENYLKLRDLTRQAVSELGAPPDLIVWPEGGFKLDLRYWSEETRKESYWGRVVQEFLEFQGSLDSWLLTGTQDHGTETSSTGEQISVNYNSSVLLDPEGTIRGFFHKIHLVPFSEYFPLDKEKFSGLYETLENFEISNWGVGSRLVVFQHDKMRFFTPICFEDVFSDHARHFVLQGVDAIINMSNDYWSLSPVEGTQHGILALFRAVENQRPLLRSTSSGYTVYVDAAGRIQPGSPAPYTAGYTIARVPLPERTLTLYTRWGDWFPLACAGMVPLLLCLGISLPSRAPKRAARDVARCRARLPLLEFALDGEPLCTPEPAPRPMAPTTECTLHR